jgi:hypothetical protein
VIDNGKLLITPINNLDGEASFDLNIKYDNGTLKEPTTITFNIERSDFKKVLVDKCGIEESVYVSAWDKGMGVYDGDISCGKKINQDDLLSFIDLKKVGNISISHNNLTTLSGLNNLEEVNYFTFWDNSITDISALSNLKKVGDRLEISYNNITNLKPLSNISSITGILHMSNNPNLKDLTGLENIEHGYRNLYIDNNQYTTKLPLSSKFCSSDWSYPNTGTDISDVCDMSTNLTFNGNEEVNGVGRELPSTILSDQLIKIDHSKSYNLSFDAISGNDDGTEYQDTNRQYAGFAQYDADNNFIRPAYIIHRGDTELVEDLKDGNTSMYVKDASNWYDMSTAPYYRKTFVWYPYTNAKGYTYPDYTYTRHHSGYNAIDSITKISDNKYEIKLQNPWNGGTLITGTKIANSSDGGVYNYSLNNQHINKNWTHYEYTISGIENNYNHGTKFNDYSEYIRVIFLPNYNNSGNSNRLRIKNIKWQVIE